MDLLINELSFEGQAPTPYDGMLLTSVLIDLVVSFKKLPKSREVFVHSGFYNARVTEDLTIVDCLRRLPQNDATGVFFRLIARGRYIDRELEAEIPNHVCSFNGRNVSGSSLAGAVHLCGCLASLPNSLSLSGWPIRVEFSRDGILFNHSDVRNFVKADTLRQSLWLKYAAIPKHERGGWGALMELVPNVAELVLNCGIADERQIYGCYQGQLFAFQYDNAGTYHGYPVTGVEVPNRVLREMREADAITETEYQNFIGQAPPNN